MEAITQERIAPQVFPDRAELTGSETCRCGALTVRGHAPVLVLCRELIAAGADPDRALDVYRGATLALRVRSIGQAARYTVKTAGNGAPMFALDGPGEGAAASPVRRLSAETGVGATHV